MMAAPKPLESKLDFALRAAGRGLRIYPMAPNSDQPALPEGDLWATTDESQVLEWWQADPDCNIGIATDNLLALRTRTEAGANELGRVIRQGSQETPKTTRISLEVADDADEQDAYTLFSLPKGATAKAIVDVFPGVTALAFDDVIVGPGSVVNGVRCLFANKRPVAPAPLYLMELCGVQLPESNSLNNVIPMKKPVVAPAPNESAAPVAIPVKTKLDWAMEASQYIPVHPLRWYVDPGPDATPEEREKAAKAAKAPLLNDWPNRATQDPDQVRQWWKQWPEANIGGATNDFIVVDIDNRNGGDQTFAGLIAAEYDFPETATTRTQGGGQHLFYVAPDGPVKGGTHKLGPGIDIQARGKYVVLPGSTIEGRMYARENARPSAFAPQWLVDQLKLAKPKTAEAGKRIVEEDEISLEMARNYIEKHAPRAHYGNTDDTTNKVAAMLYDFGCEQSTVYEKMLGWNETHCDPPGDIDRLAVVVESSGRNRENAIGCKHPLAPGFEVQEITERSPPLAPTSIPSGDLIQTSAEFVEGFIPPEYLVDQVLQRRFCYSITAQTGVGKTAVAMLLSAHVASGRSLGNLEVEKGTVLYFAGENPTDIQMRWLGLTRDLGLDPKTTDMHFIPGAMPLSQVSSRIAQEVARKGLRPSLVVIDTAAAYFEGDDENSNTQAVAHAKRMRSLTELPGGPCVLILCHPTKRAADDDLIPRGGGAFLAEVDGNIALQKRESLIAASSLGKFRGRDFAPLSFELKTVQHPVLKDARGRSIPTVVARHLGEVEKQRITADTLSRENQLLKAVHDRPDASLRELAEMLGWRFKTGQPDQSKVTRALEVLAKAKLVRKHGRQWEVTSTGLSELEKSARPADPPAIDENRCISAATDETDTRSKTEPLKRATKRVLQSATK